MRKHQLDQFQERLEQERDETLRSLASSEREARELQVDYPQDVGEQSVTSLSRELLFQQGTQKRRLLRSIEAALKRIREATFGECLSCGNEIGLKRLEAMPFTAYCRDCMENLESERASHPESGPSVNGQRR